MPQLAGQEVRTFPLLEHSRLAAYLAAYHLCAHPPKAIILRMPCALLGAPKTSCVPVAMLSFVKVRGLHHQACKLVPMGRFRGNRRVNLALPLASRMTAREQAQAQRGWNRTGSRAMCGPLAISKHRPRTGRQCASPGYWHQAQPPSRSCGRCNQVTRPCAVPPRGQGAPHTPARCAHGYAWAWTSRRLPARPAAPMYAAPGGRGRSRTLSAPPACHPW